METPRKKYSTRTRCSGCQASFKADGSCSPGCIRKPRVRARQLERKLDARERASNYVTIPSRAKNLKAAIS